MADLVLGLAKTTVEGTVTMARSAMEEEAKLQKSVQRDLSVISDEFEMMHSFLEDAKDDHVMDNVTRTLVRQVRNMALDVEDCIEIIVHLDHKSHWWRHMMLPWCMPAAAPGEDLHAAIANIEKLKARVEAMGQRNLRYNRIGDSGHKPAEQTHKQAVANVMAPNILGSATGVAKQSSQVDLVMLISWSKGGAEGGQGHHMLGDKDGDDCYYDCDGELKVDIEVDDVLQLKVISVVGTGSDLEIISIKKAYDDRETCKSFNCRAWVKLVHPFHPIEFIRSLLAQFHKNAACPGQDNTAKVLDVMVATAGELIEEFKKQISQKYLVVLEDLPTMVDWEALRVYLLDNKNGSCIVVHTRHLGIACSCVGHKYQISELEKLSADDSVRVVYKEDVAGKVEEGTVNKEETAHEWIKSDEICIGRDTDLSWLHWLTGQGGVVSVWGMSGVGKSFLVQHFYRMKMTSTYNPHKFGWVNVSRPFDLRVLSRSLHSEFNPASRDQVMSSIKDPIQECREYLQREENGPYFTVIDGLQSKGEWDMIKRNLDFRFENSFGKPSNIVIIITNEESVANHCATDKYMVWNVKGLEVSEAIKLFDQVANKRWPFWENANLETKHRNDELRHILLQKCGGLAKVICAVAESLDMVYDIKVKDNLVSKLEATRSLEDMVSWLHSYFGSCPDFLKPCIFYLTIFPANHTIRRRRLVRRWIVEGYIWDNTQITAEETANEFFSRLVNLSMIQPPRLLRNLLSTRRMPLCQVNGFLREYVLSRLMEENFVFELEGNCKNLQRELGTDHNYIKGMGMGCIIQHLAIDKSWDRDRNVFKSIDFSRLRSLTVFGRWESFFISDKMGRLRVLDLEDVSSGLTNGDVEKMVKQLRRLKFLSLRRCKQITRLPDSLGDLKQLQTLDIRETSVINLPKSIIKLEELQYIRGGTTVNLDNNNTAGTFGGLPVAEAAANPSTSAPPMRRPRATPGSWLSKLWIQHIFHQVPHNGLHVPREIGKLSCMHTLGVVNVSGTGGEEILDELKNLTLLHKLGVYGINRKNSEKLFSAISRLAHLESLSLQFQLNEDHEAAIALSPLVELRSLKLYGLVDRLPTWIKQMCLQLPRLEKLDLQMKMLPQEELDLILTLRHLRSLRLRLAEFEDGELRFGWSIAQYSSGWIINFLDFACNSKLQAVKFGSKVDVEILKIRCCNVSSSLQFSGLRSIDSLKEVWLSGSYDHAFKLHLESELKANENKPILELEEQSSPST